MKSTRQHLDELLAAEGDERFDGITASVKAFRRKQTLESQMKSSTFVWIETTRELSQIEHTLSTQIERIQNDLGVAASPRSQEPQKENAMSLVETTLNNALSAQNNENLFRKMILETKQSLFTLGEELEHQCIALEEETRLQRHRALQLVSDERNQKRDTLPPSLIKALDSLCMLDAGNEVELLKQDLVTEFEAAKHENDSIQCGRRSHRTIVKKSLGKIERVRKRIIEMSRITAKRETNDARQQEMHATLKLLRLERQQESKEQNQEEIKVVEDALTNLQQSLESKLAILKHHEQSVQEHEKENANDLLHCFEGELVKQRAMSFNIERSRFREKQRENKLIALKEAEKKQEKERELQIYRLSALAASCPYTKRILDIESDILKTTKAREYDFFRKQNDLADFQKGILTSFTNEKVFSDYKFRLGNALHEAGISNTIAARDVVRNTIPRSEERATGIRPY